MGFSVFGTVLYLACKCGYPKLNIYRYVRRGIQQTLLSGWMDGWMDGSMDGHINLFMDIKV